MATTTRSTDTLYAPTGGVQTLYTEDMVRRSLHYYVSVQGMSLREVAQIVYHGLLTHADIQRALKGVFPKSSHKRRVFGLPALVPVAPCAACGEVHVTRRCTHRQGHKRARFSVSYDPGRVAAAIKTHIPPEDWREIAEELFVLDY